MNNKQLGTVYSYNIHPQDKDVESRQSRKFFTVKIKNEIGEVIETTTEYEKWVKYVETRKGNI